MILGGLGRINFVETRNNFFPHLFSLTYVKNPHFNHISSSKHFINLLILSLTLAMPKFNTLVSPLYSQCDPMKTKSFHAQKSLDHCSNNSCILGFYYMLYSHYLRLIHSTYPHHSSMR